MNRRFCCLWTFAWMAATVGCSNGQIELSVDLRTDYVPFEEFDRVTVQLNNERGQLSSEEVMVGAGWQPAQGARLTTFRALERGDYRVEVWLTQNGEQFAVRELEITVREDFSVTAAIFRLCEGVSCGSDQSCFEGECVDPRCSPETPQFCPTSRCSDERCNYALPEDSCGSSVCADGLCFAVEAEGSCPASQYCAVNDGVCRDRTYNPDAGVADAGTDALNPCGADCTGVCFQSSCYPTDDCYSFFGVPCPVFNNGALTNPDSVTPNLFGHSLALAGSRLLVGDPGANRAYLFDAVADEWELTATFEPDDSGESGERFGERVEITPEGDRVAIADGSPGPVGAVYVFVQNEGSWDPHRIASPMSASALDLQIDNQWLAIGLGKEGEEGDRGRVRLFRWNGTTYAPDGHPAITSSSPSFGEAVAFDTQWLVAGGENGGSLRVWEYRESRFELTETELEPSYGFVENNHFGHAIALEGSFVVVGDPGYDNPEIEEETNLGMVHVYQIGAEGEGPVSRTALELGSSVQHSLFGAEVSLSGLWLAVGAPSYQGALGPAVSGSVPSYQRESWRGLVAIYHRSSFATEFSLKALLTSPEAGNNRYFGAAVSVSGDLLAIGAPGANPATSSDPTGTSTGRVWIRRLAP